MRTNHGMPANFLRRGRRRCRIAFFRFVAEARLRVFRLWPPRKRPQGLATTPIGDPMKHIVIVIAALIAVHPIASAQDKPLNWVKVTDNAGWTPRDSQGELVYRDQLWIFGGWFQSFEAPPRDVWSSADGKTWKQVTKEAPWKHSDLPMTLVHNDKMWIMGGWYNGRLKGHSASNEVWSSTDGAKWDQATKNAGWTPRLAAGAVVFKNKMWI